MPAIDPDSINDQGFLNVDTSELPHVFLTPELFTQGFEDFPSYDYEGIIRLRGGERCDTGMRPEAVDSPWSDVKKEVCGNEYESHCKTSFKCVPSEGIRRLIVSDTRSLDDWESAMSEAQANCNNAVTYFNAFFADRADLPEPHKAMVEYACEHDGPTGRRGIRVAMNRRSIDAGGVDITGLCDGDDVFLLYAPNRQGHRLRDRKQEVYWFEYT